MQKRTASVGYRPFLLLFYSRFLRVDGADDFWRELRVAVIGIKPVDLLLHIGQLRIAERADGAVLEQRGDQPAVARDELFPALRAVAVAPAALWMLGILPDAAELADKRGLADMLAEVDDRDRLAAFERQVARTEGLGVLIVVMHIEDVGQRALMRPA